jgi:hypothetical protein
MFQIKRLDPPNIKVMNETTEDGKAHFSLTNIESKVTEEEITKSHTFGYDKGKSSVEWNVDELWKYTENFPVKVINISEIREYVKHVASSYDTDDWERVKDADISYPIIISANSTSVTLESGKKITTPLIIDGFHRAVKLLRNNATFIKVKIVRKMPLPNKVSGKPFKINGLDFEWKTK